MFKLLSKESNIFSIPVYIAFLLLFVITFNILNFRDQNVLSLVVTFVGIALGYFCFSSIGLSLQTHLTLFLYTLFVFAFYPGYLDIGLAVAILTNSFLILLLTNVDEDFRKKSYVLVGSIIAVNYIFFPATWPMAIFVILHILATSERIALHLFRLIFGIFLVAASYFSLMFALGFRKWDDAYLPFLDLKWNQKYVELLYLTPVLLMLIIGIFDHFKNYNKKSPTNRFKYTFLLVFFLAQVITIFLYMGASHGFLLLIAIPASIIISRMLRFLNKYWQQELGLWIVILSLLAFKLSTIL